MITLMNVHDTEKLFRTVDLCESPVTLHTSAGYNEDLRNNAFARRILGSAGRIARLELDVHNPKDAMRMLRFMMDEKAS